MTAITRGISPARLLRLCLLTVAGMMLAAAAAAAEGIQVSGRGVVTAVPDMGTVRLQVRREGKDPAPLTAQLDEVVEQVLGLTRKLKIKDADVTAAMVSVQPRYERRGDDVVVEGVVATRTITVTLRKLDDFPRLLSGALTLGINNVDPLQLAIEPARRAELEQQALELAMADAREQARRVAAGFGVTLGSVVDVQVSWHTVQPRPEMVKLAMTSDAGPFEPGSMDVEQSLLATFAIIPDG